MRRRDRYEIKKLPNGNSETIDHAYASTISLDIDGKRKAFISSTARLTSWLIFSGNSMRYCRLLNTPDALEQIVGRERRERERLTRPLPQAVLTLAWCGKGALIRAAASTQPLCCY